MGHAGRLTLPGRRLQDSATERLYEAIKAQACVTTDLGMFRKILAFGLRHIEDLGSSDEREDTTDPHRA